MGIESDARELEMYGYTQGIISTAAIIGASSRNLQ
jgi:hypothetical protein